MAIVNSIARNSRARNNAPSIVHTSAWVLLLAAASFAGQSVSSYRDPAELVRKTVQNEINASNDVTAHFLFRSTKTTSKGSTTRIYVEAKGATAGLLIAINGKPLTPEQRQEEDARNQRFISNPEELRKKREREREDDERSMRIIRALPDAFLYEFVGEEKGSEGIGRPGAPLLKLHFRPNPRYEPPSRVEEVLAGMQGYLLVDAATCRMASIDGTLFKTVGFGWGILGRLDRGGRFVVHQQQVDGNAWMVSSMILSFTGKILLFKNLSISSTEIFSGFKRVRPDLTFAQALEMLKLELLKKETS